MRLIGYVRVSRVAGREGESFISPAVQRERIEAQAKAGGHVLVDVVSDLDEPGSKYERPRFQEALGRIEGGEADGLIVYALDRFARSVPDAAVALRRLEHVGAVLVSVRDALDTSTPVGKFARTMMLALAELELDRIRETWATARDRAIARGVHISNVPPVGYQRAADGRLEPDPVAAPVIREVFRRRAAGASWRELCDILDERLPRENGGAWGISTVHGLVGRRTYLGEAAAGDVVNRDAHPPLVTRAEFEAAQGAQTVSRGRNGDGALLAGLLVCASCGGRLTHESDGRRGYSNYACRGRSAAGVCAAPAKISLRRADAHVEGAFLDWLAKERVALEGAPSTAGLAEAEERVTAAQAELAAYRDANLVSILGRDTYVAGLANRAAVVEETRRALAEQRKAGDLDHLLSVDLAETWGDLSISERRMILTAAIEFVEVGRSERRGQGTPAAERLVIRWRGLALARDGAPEQVRAA